MSQSKTYADGQIDKYAPIPWCGSQTGIKSFPKGTSFYL